MPTDEECTAEAREHAATACYAPHYEPEMTPFGAILARTQFEDERAAYRAFVEAQP